MIEFTDPMSRFATGSRSDGFIVMRDPRPFAGNHRQVRNDTSMRKKLLIVDDQVGMTQVVAMVAGQLGFEVEVLNTALNVVDTFLQFRPDIVILDMIMPEKDGIDVLHEILLTGVDTKIVLTSGLSEAYLRLAEGVAQFHDVRNVSILRKPFRRHDLIKALQLETAEMVAE
jgi:CheY-like chemotaxis protein